MKILLLAAALAAAAPDRQRQDVGEGPAAD
jgi:hypothetical protein